MIYYENPLKLSRAKDIISLLSRTTKNDNEEDDKRKFGALLADKKIKPDSEDAITFIYEMLGGLVRTEKEHQAAEQNKKDIKKKKKIEV